MELKQNGNDIPDTKLFVETFGTIISCVFCFCFFLLSLKLSVCRPLQVRRQNVKPINFSVETVAASRPCGSVTEMRTAATAAMRTHVVRKNTLLSHSNANNLKCEGLRLMHVARFVQLRITEVNGFQMSHTIIDYYSLNLNIQVIRPLHMSGNVV